MNKIDWKIIAQSSGYKSLKAAYINDVQKGWRSKKESYAKFRWVIDRVKHYAHHKGVQITTILNSWETNRDHWWFSYYQDCYQPKLHSNSKKSPGIKGIRKYYKSSNWTTPQQTKNRLCKLIQEKQRNASTKKKKRWTRRHKKSVS